MIKPYYHNLKRKFGPQITFGDNNKGFTMGYDNLDVGNVIIKDISLIGGLKLNLLSIIQFTDKDYKVKFVKNICLISHKKTGQLALSGVRKGRLFVVDLDSVSKETVCCFYTKASSKESMLWHIKLSHLNFKAINSLVKREMLRDIPALEYKQEEVCEACQTGKIKRSNHKLKEFSSITAPVQLIHMDLFGPVNVMTLSKKKYALVMVDDSFRYTWVKFLYSKYEGPQIIIDHLTKTQNTAQANVVALRSDNGTEFRNALLEFFCIENSITQQFSAPRTPQQNGVVERKNRTLIEAARTILHDADLPTSLWAEAINTTCYIQNRTLVNKSVGNTPYFIMRGRKPTAKHLHVFGSKYKFDSKALEANFLRYSLERTSYRVYVIPHQQVMENMDVTFDDKQLS